MYIFSSSFSFLSFWIQIWKQYWKCQNDILFKSKHLNALWLRLLNVLQPEFTITSDNWNYLLVQETDIATSMCPAIILQALVFSVLGATKQCMRVEEELKQFYGSLRRFSLKVLSGIIQICLLNLMLGQSIAVISTWAVPSFTLFILSYLFNISCFPCPINPILLSENKQTDKQTNFSFSPSVF